jgi:hypothetical protein
LLLFSRAAKGTLPWFDWRGRVYSMAQKIDKREISRNEADRILEIEESHYIDLKTIETEPAALSEVVAADIPPRI